jgi:hypothetical protein
LGISGFGDFASGVAMRVTVLLALLAVSVSPEAAAANKHPADG